MPVPGLKPGFGGFQSLAPPPSASAGPERAVLPVQLAGRRAGSIPPLLGANRPGHATQASGLLPSSVCKVNQLSQVPTRLQFDFWGCPFLHAHLSWLLHHQGSRGLSSGLLRPGPVQPLKTPDFPCPPLGGGLQQKHSSPVPASCFQNLVSRTRLRGRPCSFLLLFAPFCSFLFLFGRSCSYSILWLIALPSDPIPELVSLFPLFFPLPPLLSFLPTGTSEHRCESAPDSGPLTPDPTTFPDTTSSPWPSSRMPSAAYFVPLMFLPIVWLSQS